MKTFTQSKFSRLLPLCFTALGTFSMLSQTPIGWHTILDYQSYPACSGQSLVADSFGNVYTAGVVSGASVPARGQVLRSDATKSTWFLSDDTNPAPAQNKSFIYQIGQDLQGGLYSIGMLMPNSSNPYWFIRKSSDSGLNWSTIDLFQYSPGKWSNASGFAADGVGNIYVVGWGRDAGTKKNPSGDVHWLVRKSSDGGQTWRNVDDLLGTSGAHKAGFVPGIGVFVVGALSTTGTGWLVRRSATGEPGTWSTVDGPISEGAAHGITSDHQGSIYVVGETFIQTGVTKGRTTGYYAWTTRQSMDGGNTWATVDVFNYSANQTSGAYTISQNSSGNVTVAGRGADAQGKMHWVVRTRDSSGAWHTTDDYQLVAGGNATAIATMSDAGGNLFVTGWASDGENEHWMVRRLSNANP